MSGRNNLEPKLPITQSVEAVKTSITTINNGHEPEESKRQAHKHQARIWLLRNAAKLGQGKFVDSIMPENAGRWNGQNNPLEAV